MADPVRLPPGAADEPDARRRELHMAALAANLLARLAVSEHLEREDQEQAALLAFV